MLHVSRAYFILLYTEVVCYVFFGMKPAVTTIWRLHTLRHRALLRQSVVGHTSAARDCRTSTCSPLVACCASYVHSGPLPQCVQVKELGAGSFGTCKLAIDSDGEYVAVKLIPRGRKVRFSPRLCRWMSTSVPVASSSACPSSHARHSTYGCPCSGNFLHRIVVVCLWLCSASRAPQLQCAPFGHAEGGLTSNRRQTSQ